MDHLLSLDFFNCNQSLRTLAQKKIQTIGFYFGSFDPFHDGHMEVAEVMLTFCDVVLITTVKKNKEKPWLSTYEHRTWMISNYLRACNNKPIYLIRDNLISAINKLKPSFHLFGVIGSDVYLKFIEKNRIPKMKVHEWFIIPRVDYSIISNDDLQCWEKKTIVLSSDLFRKQGFSSTQIRRAFKTGNLNEIPLLSENIKYIQEHRLYT